MSTIFQKPPFNYQYKVGIANSVDFETTIVTLNNNLAVSTPLQDVVFPANTFAQDGQRGQVIGIGSANNPTASYTIGVTVNGTIVFTIVKGTIALTQGWRIEIELFRRGTNLLVIVIGAATISVGSTSAIINPQATRNILTSAVIPFDQVITVTFTALNGGAGDTISQESAWSSIQ